MAAQIIDGKAAADGLRETLPATSRNLRGAGSSRGLRSSSSATIPPARSMSGRRPSRRWRRMASFEHRLPTDCRKRNSSR